MASEKGPGLPPPNPPAYPQPGVGPSQQVHEPAADPVYETPITGPEYPAPPTTVGPMGPGYAAPPYEAGQKEPGYAAPPPTGAPFYPPPPGPVFSQPMGGPPAVVVQQHIFRQQPVNTTCPHCRHNIITSTRAEAGGLTWLLCFIIAILGFWLGCCLIPFCIDDCQDITHSCPNCRNTIYVFKRL